jgi:thiamine pyrophosphate-dependent acetolactate synthase large subunit-like protein
MPLSSSRLNAGKKIVILAGRGALHAGDELEQIAQKLGAPIVKAFLGKAAVPDDSPYTTGGIGLLGTKPSQEAGGRSTPQSRRVSMRMSAAVFFATRPFLPPG